MNKHLVNKAGPVKNGQRVAQEAKPQWREESPAEMFLLCGDFIYSLFIVRGWGSPVCITPCHFYSAGLADFKYKYQHLLEEQQTKKKSLQETPNQPESNTHMFVSLFL